MVLLEQELLVLHNEQRTADAAGVSVDADLSLSNVSYHGHFRHDDVHLATQPTQRVHQVLRLLVDAHPATIHKDLSCTGTHTNENQLLNAILTSAFICTKINYRVQ